MWNKIKVILNRSLDFVAGILLVLAGVLYMFVTGCTISLVLNDLRLDTYVDFTTGMGIVLATYLLVWVPLVMLRARGGRR
jgi:hypothetical protein